MDLCRMEQRSPPGDSSDDKQKGKKRPNVGDPGQVHPARIDMGIASLPSSAPSSADAFLTMWENPMDSYFASLQQQNEGHKQRSPLHSPKHDIDNTLKIPAAKSLPGFTSSAAAATGTGAAGTTYTSQTFPDTPSSTQESEEVDKKRPPVDGSLRPYDIIVGRGRKHESNTGNARFRVTIRLNLKQYIEAPTRQDKTIVILSTYHMLRDDIGARFVKCTEDGRYVDCDEQEARDKVAHAFRDLAAQNSKKNKKSRRLSSSSLSSTSSSRSKGASNQQGKKAARKHPPPA